MSPYLACKTLTIDEQGNPENPYVAGADLRVFSFTYHLSAGNDDKK